MGMTPEQAYILAKNAGKGKFRGSIPSLTAGNEQAQLNAFAPGAENGDTVSVTASNQVWKYSGSTGQWAVYSTNQAIGYATKGIHGIVRAGNGINVAGGVISTDADTLGLGKAVKYEAQTMTVEQKLQARNNIDAAGKNEQSDWNETDTASHRYIAHKPLIPTKTSELINDDFTVKDQDYDGRVFAGPAEKNNTIGQVAQNKSDIADLRVDVDDVVDDLNAEVNRSTTTDNDLQTQINLLQGKTQFIGSTNCAAGDEQNVLSAYVIFKTGRTPRAGDTVSIPTDGAGNTRQEQWQYVVTDDGAGTELKYWELVFGPPVVTTATETGLGVAMFPAGGGLRVDTDGKVTVNKRDIDLDKVDNIKQYSANNLPPMAVTVDGTVFRGDTQNLVIDTGSVKYDEMQSLTETQKAQARNNIGVTSGVKPDWAAAEAASAGILNKPTKLSEFTNDIDGMVIDEHYGERVFADLAEKRKYLTQIDTNKADIETLRNRSLWIGSIQDWSTPDPDDAQKNVDLTEAVRVIADTTPAEGYQVTVLSESAVYQYSEASGTWQVFVENKDIEFATETKAGVVKVGDGLSINAAGVLTADAKKGLVAKDWNENDSGSPKFIQNRTHYEKEGFAWTFNSADYSEDTLMEEHEAILVEKNWSPTAYAYSARYRLRIGDYVKVDEIFGNPDNYVKTPERTYNIATQCKLFDQNEHGAALIPETGGGSGFCIMSDGNYLGQFTNNVIYPEGVWVDIFFVQNIGSLDIHVNSRVHEIKVTTGNVKKLDAKYLPSPTSGEVHDWVRTAYNAGDPDDPHTVTGEQSDWKDTDATSSAYIKNKPFGELPLLNGKYDGTPKEDELLYVNQSTKFYWVSDEIGNPAEISEALDTVRISLNIDPEAVYSGAEVFSNPEAGVTRYAVTLPTGAIYPFVVISEARYDGATLRNRKGLYIGAPKADGTYIRKLYTTKTYTAPMATINGQGATQISVYAPTTGGVPGQIPVSMGNGEAPKYVGINGANSYASQVPSVIYAPTSSGEMGQIAISNGYKNAPSYVDVNGTAGRTGVPTTIYTPTQSAARGNLVISNGPNRALNYINLNGGDAVDGSDLCKKIYAPVQDPGGSNKVPLALGNNKRPMWAQIFYGGFSYAKDELKSSANFTYADGLTWKNHSYSNGDFLNHDQTKGPIIKANSICLVTVNLDIKHTTGDGLYLRLGTKAEHYRDSERYVWPGEQYEHLTMTLVREFKAGTELKLWSKAQTNTTAFDIRNLEFEIIGIQVA